LGEGKRQSKPTGEKRKLQETENAKRKEKSNSLQRQQRKKKDADSTGNPRRKIRKKAAFVPEKGITPTKWAGKRSRQG